jgi:hypothetical protein
MAATIRGLQPLQWGTTAITGYVVENIGNDQSGGEFTIENEGGDTVTQITGFSVKNEVTVEVVPLTATVKPAAGDLFTYGTTTISIISVSEKEVKKDVVKWTIKGTFYPLVDLTPGP